VKPDFARLAAPIVAADLALEPLGERHAAALALAFAEDELWNWMLVAQPRSREDVDAWVVSALERASASEQAPFVIVRPDGSLAGTTRYLQLRWHDAGVEIGWTMIFANARGGWINSRVKALMLERAFSCGFERVHLQTDARNARSRAAIAAIGARFEGVLRSFQRRADGTLRDTAVFSILAAEWPAVQIALEARALRAMENR